MSVFGAALALSRYDNSVVVLKLQDIGDVWFQRNGTTCHTVREINRLLHESFPGHVISR